MADEFKVGEFAELCNLPPWSAQKNGTEVVIVELAAFRSWKNVDTGELQHGYAYIISFEHYAYVACRPEYLRKKSPPIDTIDSAEPNKKTQWADGPWKPEFIQMARVIEEQVQR